MLMILFTSIYDIELSFGHLVPNMQEEFEDTKRVIIIRKSKKDKQHNGQTKKDKQRSTKQYV